MKTYIEMEKLTPKRLWKFPQKRFGALVGPFSRFFGDQKIAWFIQNYGYGILGGPRTWPFCKKNI